MSAWPRGIKKRARPWKTINTRSPRRRKHTANCLRPLGGWSSTMPFMTPVSVRRSITTFPRVTLQAAVHKAKTLRRPNGYFDFLDDHHSYVRQFAPQFLNTLSFASHQAD